jgi:hypothetical protein
MAAAPEFDAGRFSRAISMLGTEESVTIVAIRIDASHVEYRADHFRSGRTKGEPASATSRSCPAIREIVASMPNIPLPRPAPYGLNNVDRGTIFDGNSYKLQVPTNYPNSQMTIVSNVGSPLAAWVDGALKKLEPCWKKG